MSYEIFNGSSRSIGPIASIQANGVLRLNTEAAALLREIGAQQILVMWDRQRRKIGLAKAPKEDLRAYRLMYHPKKYGAKLALKAFLRHIGVKPLRSFRMPVGMNKSVLEMEVPAEHIQGSVVSEKKSRSHKKPEQ